MKISGFTFAKNTSKLYYPIKESIESILPIVDEFVIALGDSDPDDTTRELIESIDSDKIRIIDTVWDTQKYPRGMEHAHQTDIAKEACSGDWLFYLQADEVVHEADLPKILARCEELLEDEAVEGLLFKYYHFWGDYEHYHTCHGWYPQEVRIVRNRPDIHSFISAQSFRRIPDFDGVSYRSKEGTHKLKVATVDAHIYHYGWVRPPRYMQTKRNFMDRTHKGKETADAIHSTRTQEFDYGPLNQVPRFKGTHPAVMQPWIERMDWQDKLQYSGQPDPDRPKYKHEKLKNKIISFFEKLLNRPLFLSKNYQIIKR